MCCTHAQTKIKQPLCVCTWELSDGWVRVDCASRAVFALSSATAPQLFESARPALRKVYKTENPVPGSDTGSLGGRGWIRTTEAEKQQIYSLSPLATREHAQILFTSLPDDLFILADKSGFVNRFFAFFQLLFSSAKKTAQLGGNPPLRLRRFANDSWSVASPLLSVPDASGAHSPGGPQWPRRKADRAR